MICAPSVNSWGSADRALGQHAVSLQLHYWLGNMVALFGSELSVFSSSVLFDADEKKYYFLHQVLLMANTANTFVFMQSSVKLTHRERKDKCKIVQITSDHKKNPCVSVCCYELLFDVFLSHI